METLQISERKKIMKWGKGLPPCIGTTIFSKLVISTLPICRLVCRTWNDLVLNYASSTEFHFLTNAFLLSTCDEGVHNCPNCQGIVTYNPKMQCVNLDIRKHLGTNFDLEMELVKSASLLFDGDGHIPVICECNGLLFITKNDIKDGIFNPMTNEFIPIPGCDEFYIIGFGFSPNTKQYKLFRVLHSKGCNVLKDPVRSEMEMDVLILGEGNGTKSDENQWRHIQSLSLPFHFFCTAYMNGVVYWLGKEKDEDVNQLVVYALDVETEEIELSATLEVGLVGRVCKKMYKFNGTIYATFTDAESFKTIQVWRMQEKGLWIKEFVMDDIPTDWRGIKLVKAFEDGELLCLVNCQFFCFYNPSTKKKKIVPENQKQFRSICGIESLKFGSLLDILTGD